MGLVGPMNGDVGSTEEISKKKRKRGNRDDDGMERGVGNEKDDKGKLDISYRKKEMKNGREVKGKVENKEASKKVLDCKELGESNEVVDSKGASKIKYSSNGKDLSEGKGVDGSKNVVENRALRNVKQTSTHTKKKDKCAMERKDGDDVEHCLSQFHVGDPIEADRKNEVVDDELEKHRRKKSKKGKKGEGNLVEPLLEEVLDQIHTTVEHEKDNEVMPKDGDAKKLKRTDTAVQSTSSSQKKKTKSVNFSEEVEVFPLSDDTNDNGESSKDKKVYGKRFSQKEDKLIIEAISSFIEEHDLGENGWDMVFNCAKYRRQLRNCWKEIAQALPWRPQEAIYCRAHVIYSRGDFGKWEPEEIEALKRLYEEHGPKWKALAEILGKNRKHVKDVMRRVKVANLKTGPMTQDEYQQLFELVNMDLQMKAFEKPKNNRNGMLRDNISWTAISDQMTTRPHYMLCTKWYDQLTSPMVADKKWENADDYRMVGKLLEVDATCVDDVDWDNLVDDRPGDICLKRWYEMTRRIGEHRNNSFPEQVEVLATRYVPDLAGVVEHISEGR